MGVAVGLALSGAVAANAADAAEGATAVTVQANTCQSSLTTTERSDGFVEYHVTASCLHLELRVQARAVTTFESADGVRREVATPWITHAPGSAEARIVTQDEAIDTRIEYRRSPA
ncbi:hypothetical protein [Agromyces aerolatus]|uniref:hypothetical protein n=1 Tax=Agromyces sp. LY-1074 TaxID=3074080 RepID=UPI00285BA1D4|nr:MULTISPECIES: hypothetical protein [unclassified Agromyces]MDR5700536.1 hypothetical protein [Agromyces sp. LY-1074]MDR5707057.1 hypothetical protein [Agromyces sp. LY-1358]